MPRPPWHHPGLLSSLPQILPILRRQTTGDFYGFALFLVGFLRHAAAEGTFFMVCAAAEGNFFVVYAAAKGNFAIGYGAAEGNFLRVHAAAEGNFPLGLSCGGGAAVLVSTLCVCPGLDSSWSSKLG